MPGILIPAHRQILVNVIRANEKCRCPPWYPPRFAVSTLFDGSRATARILPPTGIAQYKSQCEAVQMPHPEPQRMPRSCKTDNCLRNALHLALFSNSPPCFTPTLISLLHTNLSLLEYFDRWNYLISHHLYHERCWTNIIIQSNCWISSAIFRYSPMNSLPHISPVLKKTPFASGIEFH